MWCKRILLGLLVLILIAALSGAALAQKPEPPATEPPPPPSGDDEGKDEAPPTPVPEDKPTSLPTPTPTKEPAPLTPTTVPTNVPSPTPVPRRSTATPPPSPTPAPTPVPVITGQVFEDRDSDGVRDSDEPGVAGVPVTLDGEVVGATDGSGRFTVTARGKALLAIIPPEGWQWNGSPLTAEGENDVVLPLNRLNAGRTEGTESATAATAVGSAVLDVGLLAVLMFVGFALLTQTAATRSLERTYRQHKSLELEHLQVQTVARRRAELEKSLEEQADNWREIVHQVLADAVPSATNEWVTVTDVSASPPHFTAARQEGSEEYVFTVAPDGVRRGRLTRRNRVIPLDASLSPTVRTEVQAVWQHLMNQHGLERRVLPRQAAWYLVVTRRRKRND